MRNILKPGLMLLALSAVLPALAQTSLTNLSNRTWVLTFSDRQEDQDLLGVGKAGYQDAKIDVFEGNTFQHRLSRGFQVLAIPGIQEEEPDEPATAQAEAWRTLQACRRWDLEPGKTIRLVSADPCRTGVEEFLTLQDEEGFSGILDLKLKRIPKEQAGWLSWMGWAPETGLKVEFLVDGEGFHGGRKVWLRDDCSLAANQTTVYQLIRAGVHQDAAGNVIIRGGDWPGILGEALCW